MPESFEENRALKVAVAQIGARHHYAIPRMLEKAGCLETFYTDANASVGLGKLISHLPDALQIGSLRKLVQRTPKGVPASRIRHTDALLRRQIFSILSKAKGRGDYVDDDHLFDRTLAEWGFGNANVLYAMQKHGTRMLEAARHAGVRVVVDVFITPIAHQIIEQERQLFPDIEEPGIDTERMQLEETRTAREIECADLLLCPGQNVVDGLASFPNAVNKPYAIVPYGCGASFGSSRNQPVKGRVLFAGTADLRKGIHYLGMAANELGNKNYDFRVAGNVCDRIKNHPLSRDLNFLGRLPVGEMKKEFLNADVFVLPTLAEGCASVVHEAVMAGCPVITTKASGSLVRNNEGGLVVPERDHEALAKAIERVVADRGFRQDMSETCRSLADQLTEGSWSSRLLEALSDEAPQKIQ